MRLLFGKLKELNIRKDFPIFALVSVPYLITFPVSKLVNLGLPVQVAVGTVSLLLLPGYLLIEGFRLRNLKDSWFGFSIILGLTLQTLNVFTLYSVETFVNLSYVNFFLYLLLLTWLEVIFLVLLMHSKGVLHSPLITSSNVLPETGMILLFLFIGALLSNLYFQESNSSAVLPDGALYLDVARFLVTTGRLSSLVLNDGSPYSLLNVVGLPIHTGVPMVLSVFMVIGDISYQSAKIGLSLVAALFVYVVYEIAKIGLGKRAGFAAATFVFANSLLRYYTSILFGPEILSAFFTLTAILFVALFVRERGRILSILAGVMIFLSYLVWGVDTVPLLIASAILIAASGVSQSQGILRKLAQFCGPLLVFGILAVALRLSSNLVSWFLLITTILVIVGAFELIGPSDSRFPNAFGIILTFLGLVQLYFFRSYANPAAYLSLSSSPSQLLGTAISLDLASELSKFALMIWPNLMAQVTSVILITALISILWLDAKSASAPAFVFGWMISRIFLFPGSDFILTDSRFYLSIIVALIVMAGIMTERISNQLPDEFVIRTRVIDLLRRDISFLPWVKTAIVALFLVSIIIVSSYSLYAGYASTFERLSTASNGWDPILAWINNNTPSNAIFITTGSPRLWAWFADRVFVGASVVKGSQLLDLRAVNAVDFSQLINQYNASYALFDSTYQAAAIELPQLSYLYTPSPVGRILPLTSNGSSLALQVVVTSWSQENGGVVILYKVLKGGYQTIFKDTTFANWTNARGTILASQGNLTVITLNNETWGNYAYLNFKPPVLLPPNSFIEVSVLSISSPLVNGGLAVRFSDGSLVLQYFKSAGTYRISLAQHANKTVTQALLYTLLQNTSGRQWVSYGSIQLEWISG